MDEKLQLRIYGDDSLPTLIYLPGLHGDWTLVGSFRKFVLGKVRFVEMTYPRTLNWSLHDYATAIEIALLENKITHGWLLGESFGSQPLWAMVNHASQQAENNFQPEGIILAGGFVKHPLRGFVRFARQIAGQAALSLLTWIIFPVTNKFLGWLYTKLARFRYRRSTETLSKINEFLERRTPLDFQAGRHRLHLIAQNDPREIAKRTGIPIYALSGILDPIVPWFAVRRWLQKNCPALRDYKIINSADHAVLISAPKEAAKQILEWMLCLNN
jgi:pimeloyl-ACP methyl ester carboxylesterase